MFTPRIITFSSKTLPEQIRKSRCFSNGEYCPYSPKHHSGEYAQESPGNLLNAFEDRDERIHLVASKTPPRELLLSALREKCLYELVVKEDDTQVYKKWFDYMVFMQMQIAYNEKLDKDETDVGFEFLDIDPEVIEKCVNNSFAEPGNYESENRILKADREWQIV